ncbi:MAG: ABC transporter ATP-binding protein [Patulibacter minatonensis]
MSLALQLRDLRVTTEAGTELLRGVDLEIARGETVAVVGPSGAGKTMTSRVALGLLPRAWRVEGVAQVDGRPVRPEDPGALRALRLDSVGLVPQQPRAAVNPLRTIGDLLTEAARERGTARATAAVRATALLDEVGLPEPEALLRRYPHELSGGMLQRVALAAALTGDPALLIADEPTAALDVLSQAEVMAAVGRAQREHGAGLLLVTHDLDLATAVADHVAVLDAGRVVDRQPASDLARSPHPVTRALLETAAAAHLDRVPTEAPARRAPARERLLLLDGVWRDYGGPVPALRDASLAVGAGDSVAVVGGSGSGKSTLARIATGLESADRGTVSLGGSTPTRRRRRGQQPAGAQMVFQDPALSLDPRLTASAAVERALGAARVPRAERRSRARTLLAAVGLGAELDARRPRQLSGGQAQRVSIARALALEPRLLVLDEATSALDPVSRAQVLELLESLRASQDLAMLLISHDLGVVGRLADEVVVLHRGSVVEAGQTAQVVHRPTADYTRLLLDALPEHGWRPDELARRRRAIEGGASLADVPVGRASEHGAGGLQRA